jgi:hypothetical protein
MFRSAFILAATALVVTPVAAQTPISPGRTISGELTASDSTLSDQTHFDCYSVLTSPGQRIQIDQTSSAFDSYLLAGGGSCASLTNTEQNDDGGEGLNARLVLEGTGGLIYIYANSVTAGATGAYQLRASLAGPAPAVTRLNVGQTVSGTLTASDPTLPDNSHYDCFSVQTRVGQRLQIDQTSNAFDSYLSVGSGSCESLAEAARDDDSGGGLHARVLRDGDGAVLYIQANSVSAGETGAYQLRVSPAPAETASGSASGTAHPSAYDTVDPRSLAANRPTRLPATTSDWDTDAMTCYAAYGAMVAMTTENVAPREWGNVGQIDYAARQVRLRSRIDFSSPEAAMIDFNTMNFKSMALVGAIGVAPNGQPNQGRPLAEYLTALANSLTPVTRY